MSLKKRDDSASVKTGIDGSLYPQNKRLSLASLGLSP